MNKDFILNCKKLLNGNNEEIVGNDRFYNLKDICASEYTSKKLAIPIGRTDNKKNVFLDFTNVSGLFLAGATGSGKSLFIDTMIVSLMLKNTPEEIKFLFLEPFSVELGEYNGINYLLNHKKKSLTDAKDIKNNLIIIYNLIKERIDELINSHHQSIITYNKNNEEKWPHLFIIVDEGCNLIKDFDIQELLNKILDYGKPLGIHLVYATNSYLRDYPSFIAKFKYKMTFDLASNDQSKYIDIKDANWLKGEGEGLIKGKNNTIYKFQAPYISNEEINRVVLEIGKK